MTALVDPPKTVIRRMAFSKALAVIILEGVKSNRISSAIAAPTFKLSCFLSGWSAGREELPGKLIPIASMAEAMVLAVYIPPQAPGPGQAF